MNQQINTIQIYNEYMRYIYIYIYIYIDFLTLKYCLAFTLMTFYKKCYTYNISTTNPR